MTRKLIDNFPTIAFVLLLIAAAAKEWSCP